MPDRNQLTRRTTLAALALALIAAPPAMAHHGWGSFDTAQTLDWSAPVVRSSFANPHGTVVMVRDGQEITIELAPVSRMSARGLKEADIAPGQTVRVFAYRNVNEPTLYRAEWIEIAGKRIQLR